MCTYAFHPCTFSCARACVRREKRSANDSRGMHLGCNCDSEVACFPKGCLFSLPLCHLYPSCASGRLSFLVLSLRYIAEIYGLFAASAKRRGEGRLDKSLLVKRLPDCRGRDEWRGKSEGGCDLRPMAKFLSDADCSRLL